MVCITGPSHVLAALRRSLYALERSHRGRAVVHCAYDGLGSFTLKINRLSDVVCTMRATQNRLVSRSDLRLAVAVLCSI
jgi:hypothetical protein